jgi:lipopolysaccharide transport system permease protein
MIGLETASEIWKRRNLIASFALTDLKLRYRNSVLGFLWSILEPLLMLGVLYIVFTTIMRSSIENYPIYLLLGLVMWYFFARGTNMSQNSILGRAGIVTKIYFPREILPISSCMTAFIMMCLEFIVLAGFMIAFHFVPPLIAVYFPIIILLEYLFVLAISFPLSVLNVYFRDIQYIWQIILQAGFFIMPIAYNLKILPHEVQTVLKFVPIAQLIQIGHNIVLYNIMPSYSEWAYVVGITLMSLLLGYLCFKAYEKKVAEEL